ncbi:MAG: glycosyltransferase family 2 protein, partial [Vicinamibacterales bacterium]
MPALSVVMPVRDGERFLRDAIDSVLAQTFEDFEFLIVDDGSTDGTAALLDEYAGHDRRIKVHRNPRPLGAGAAINRG